MDACPLAATWRVVVVTRRHVSQLSGEKTWHVHAPPRGEELPRYSSHDFKVDEIGPPLDVFNLKQARSSIIRDLPRDIFCSFQSPA